MNRFEITVDYENNVTIIKDLDTGIEKKVSINYKDMVNWIIRTKPNGV